ncbi:MAG TPA: hypothetical protein VJY65_06865, partial [Chloroflexota bacterium]|nr:hypothetical protein [Chloroflexota bacterium]
MMDQGDVDRLADDVSRKYPYPLAATYWRAFYAAANADESHEYLLDLYEITLKYCAAIAVSQYIADGVNDAKVNQDLQHLQRPSLGHWQGWLRDILMLYHRTKRHLVVPELATFYQRSDAVGLLQAYQTLQRQVEDRSTISKVTPRQFFELLGAYRNRLAHGARPSSYAKERVANVLMPAMRELFRQLSFLAEYRLVYLSKVTVEFDERQSEPLRYAYAHSLTYLTGDSPRVSPVPQVLSQAWRDRRLYLLDKGGGFQPLLSLHPLLIFRPCERCNRHQAFVLNATKDRALDYLSYQCTHHFNPTEYVDDVRLLLEGLTATTERDRPQPSSGVDAMPLGTGRDTRDKEPTVAREPQRERQAGRRTLLRKSRLSAATPVQTTH